MAQAFFMVLREGFESFLIVAIILSYLRKTRRDSLIPVVSLAIAVSIAVSVGLGLFLSRGVNQALWEGVLGLATVVMVGTLVIHMWRFAPHLKQHIESRLKKTELSGSSLWGGIGVFVFTLVMISREGMETALMLLQVRDQGVISGILFGLAGAAVVSWMWWRYSHWINLKRFFRVTGVFLSLFMLQVAIYSFHEFSEAGMFPNSERIHEATEPFSSVGLYGQWFSFVMVAGCLIWLVTARVTERRRRSPQAGYRNAEEIKSAS
jgi:high-affinity iron transporter